jgi:hypothetical protein
MAKYHFSHIFNRIVAAFHLFHMEIHLKEHDAPICGFGNWW